MFEYNHDRGHVHESEPSLRSTPVPTHRAAVLDCSRRRPRGAGQQVRAQRRPVAEAVGRRNHHGIVAGAYAVVDSDVRRDARLALYGVRLAEDEDRD